MTTTPEVPLPPAYEAFAARYKADPADPSCGHDLDRYTSGWDDSAARMAAENAALRADLENEIRNVSAYMAERNQARDLVRHYQAELGAADKRIAELEARDTALRKSLHAYADAAYCRGIEKLRTNDALGWEQKVKTGRFGAPEMLAHKIAAEHFGAHFGIYEAIRQFDASSPAPGQSDPTPPRSRQ